MRILIHCNGGPALGVGHVIRSIALAEEALASGHEVTFVGEYSGGFVLDQLARSGAEVRRVGPGARPGEDLRRAVDEVRPDVVHLDTYDEVGVDLGAAALLSNLEDGAFGRRPADLVVDPNFGAETEPREAPPRTDGRRPDGHEAEVVMRGSRYAPLRAVVTSRRGEWQLREEARNVLVVMGGTDPQGLTPRVLEVLARTGLRLHVTAVVTPERRAEAEAVDPGRLEVELVDPVDDLPALAVRQDLVVSAAGTSVWELCCLGVPMALVCAVDNQRAGYERVVAADAAVGLGTTLQGDEADDAVRELEEALRNPATRLVLSRQASRVVDGLGAWRVVRAWEQLAQTPPAGRAVAAAPAAGPLDVRRATLDDADTLLRWRNDPQTRASSRRPDEVAHADHLAWLEASLADEHRLLLVAADEQGDVGTVRWDLVEPGVREVSITVAPERRGQGMALALLVAGERFLRGQVPDVVAADAEVHEANVASRRLFTRAGYLPDQPADEAGFLRLRKPLASPSLTLR